jgi:hypothetical protein
MSRRRNPPFRVTNAGMRRICQRPPMVSIG